MEKSSIKGFHMERVWLKILRDFGIFVLCIGLLFTPSLLLSNFGPSEIMYQDDSFDWKYTVPEAENYSIVFDQHSHTKFSDGVLTVRQNILWHIAQGYNAMVLTDHNTLRNSKDLHELAEEYAGEFIIIQGMEWTSKRIHMNFLGLSEWNLRIPSNPTDIQIQGAIDEAHSQGALVTVNHIPWSLSKMEDHPSRQQLLSWGVDYIEIVNGGTYDYDSVSWCNDSGGFGMITGTDMHRPEDVFAWTLMNTTEFTTEAVMAELSARNTTIVYNSTGSTDYSTGYDNPWFTVFSPFTYFGRMFSNYYHNTSAIPFFVGYLLLAFIFYELISFGFKRLKLKRKPI
jgi:hypothetical protein